MFFSQMNCAKSDDAYSSVKKAFTYIRGCLMMFVVKRMDIIAKLGGVKFGKVVGQSM